MSPRRHLAKRGESVCPCKHLSPRVHSGSAHNSPQLEAIQMSINRQTGTRNVAEPHKGALFSITKDERRGAARMTPKTTTLCEKNRTQTPHRV